MQSQKISIFHLNPHAYTHRHTNTHTQQKKIDATADCSRPTRFLILLLPMLDASLISSHLQGVTRHSLLHVSSRESFIRFLLPLHLPASQTTFDEYLLRFRFIICFPPNNLECALLRVLPAFSPTIHTVHYFQVRRRDFVTIQRRTMCCTAPPDSRGSEAKQKQ